MTPGRDLASACHGSTPALRLGATGGLGLRHLDRSSDTTCTGWLVVSFVRRIAWIRGICRVLSTPTGCRMFSSHSSCLSFSPIFCLAMRLQQSCQVSHCARIMMTRKHRCNFLRNQFVGDRPQVAPHCFTAPKAVLSSWRDARARRLRALPDFDLNSRLRIRLVCDGVRRYSGIDGLVFGLVSWLVGLVGRWVGSL